MSVVTRCGAVGLVMALLVGAPSALAQNAPDGTPGSSWTDPPVRGSAGPESPTAKPSDSKVDAKPPVTAEVPPPADPAKPARRVATTPAERASAKLGVKPVEGSRSPAADAAEGRRAVTRPRMVEKPLVIARRPGRVVERPARRVAERNARRSGRVYASAPEPYAFGNDDPNEGRGYAAVGARRRLAGWHGLIDDNRASRIARARESGYTIMRMQTYAYPDGTRVRRMVPYDAGGYGEFD
ncbi:MAG: hypothetical protein ABW179_01055 [Methylobacterium sp.]